MGAKALRRRVAVVDEARTTLERGVSAAKVAGTSVARRLSRCNQGGDERCPPMFSRRMEWGQPLSPVYRQVIEAGTSLVRRVFAAREARTAVVPAISTID